MNISKVQRTWCTKKWCSW